MSPAAASIFRPAIISSPGRARYEPVGFAELRAFADAYDLLRLVIETRKDQMERQRWRIRPRTPAHPAPQAGQHRHGA